MIRKSLLMLILLALPFTVEAAPSLHHDLAVEMDPERHSFQASDTLSWSVAPGMPLEFTLHADLAPRVEGAARLSRIGEGNDGVPFERYQLILPKGTRTVTLHYGGAIYHPLAAYGEGVGHDTEITPGIIAPDGVMLSGSSIWYPQFAAPSRFSFDITITLPQGWEAVSQGAREVHAGQVQWHATTPQEEIYLVAGRFTLYQRGENPSAMVYLRTPDPVLAEGYLAATERYLKLFSSLLGDYAYPKFALVENFWETGYGMPSFTLLGSRVIRLPFIIDSSYPHEVLHNWWGNGVYVDPSQGNWSEGLTAYLADHLMKEQAGHGSDYRRDQLQAYAAYVSEARDFPLSEFRGRHSGATQAIGYGKGLMFFHMLRGELGDKTFVAGLRRFYRDARFTDARFSDLRAAFETESGRDLRELFTQWTERAGAPLLTLADVHIASDTVSFTLAQTQQEAPFHLKVPVIVGFADGRKVERTVEMTERRTTANLKMLGEPACVAIDPRFDLFRRLLPGEEPVSLSAVLGGERLLILLPVDAPEPLREAYRQLAESWAAGQSGVEVRADSEFAALPTDRPVILLGWQNRHLDALRTLPEKKANEVSLEKQRWSRSDHSFVLTARWQNQPLAWLATDDLAAVAPLARKVPHYGKYSYLVFEGAAVENRLKGQWPTDDSPLIRRIANVSCTPDPEPPLVR